MTTGHLLGELVTVQASAEETVMGGPREREVCHRLKERQFDADQLAAPGRL